MNEDVFVCLEFIYILSKKCQYEISRIDIFDNGKFVEFVVDNGDLHIMKTISIDKIHYAKFDIVECILDEIKKEFAKQNMT